LYADLLEGESLTFCSQLGVLGGAEGVFPPVPVDGGLEINAIELSIAEEDHVCPRWDYRVDLFQQLHVDLFWEVTFGPLNHDPGDRQSAFPVDHADHQCQALPPDLTAVHSQKQWLAGCEILQQCASIGQEVDLGPNPLILDPAVVLLDSALFLGPIGHLLDDGG
jgi:hypothetical protein